MPSKPTGFEHLDPLRITSTSATERSGFRRCRRQWWLSVANRLDPQEGNTFAFLGNCFHAALEYYYKAIKDGKLHAEATDLGLDAYQVRFEAELAGVKRGLGFLWSTAEPAYRQAGELGFDMAQNYFAKEELDPLLDEVIAVEFRVNVDITDEQDNVLGKLSVQADVVGKKDGDLVVVDHKTRGREVNAAYLDIDDQLTAEVYSWWKASGDFPERAIYNVAYRKEAGPPKLIRKDTALSKDKGQGTTSALYRDAITANGFDVADYYEHLAWLEEREANGADPLFVREPTFRTPGQMADFERNLLNEFRDMQAIGADPTLAYPNPTPDNCKFCPVRNICTTLMDDGDVGAIIKAGFVVGDPRR